MSDKNSTHVVGCQCPRCGGEPDADPQQGLCEHKRKPSLCNVCCATQVPAPAAPLEVLTPEMVAENNAVITRFEAEVARLTSELEQAQNSREDYKRKFHALAVQLDQSQKLCRIVEACRKDAEAELEQVKAERDQYRRDWEHTDHMLKRSEERAIRAEAALGEKGQQ